jgi:hypothetical protein
VPHGIKERMNKPAAPQRLVDLGARSSAFASIRTEAATPARVSADVYID